MSTQTDEWTKEWTSVGTNYTWMDTYQALRTPLDTLKCYGDRQMNFYFYKVFQYKFFLFKINNIILKYMKRMVLNDFQSSKFLSF